MAAVTSISKSKVNLKKELHNHFGKLQVGTGEGDNTSADDEKDK